MALDHVHMCISITPKYAVSEVGFELDKVKEYISQQEETESEREKGLF